MKWVIIIPLCEKFQEWLRTCGPLGSAFEASSYIQSYFSGEIVGYCFLERPRQHPR